MEAAPMIIEKGERQEQLPLRSIYAYSCPPQSLSQYISADPLHVPNYFEGRERYNLSVESKRAERSALCLRCTRQIWPLILEAPWYIQSLNDVVLNTTARFPTRKKVNKSDV